MIGEVLALQRLGQRNGIERLTARGELGNAFENELMVAAIEIAGDEAIGNRIPHAVVEHETAEHRLLRFDGMRRYPDLVHRCLVAGASRARK